MSYSQCRVLIVDDHAHNRALLAALMEGMGIGQIEMAENGLMAIEAVERRCPDLILLDVMMPGMDGYAVCRKLRETWSQSELPILFVTALDSPEDRANCFTAGGTDMVAKPINAPEVSARVGVHLQNRMLLERLRSYQERIGMELEAARAIQENMTPAASDLSALGKLTGTRISVHAETSSELGGDFWSLLPTADGKIRVLVADFAGHGVAAALNVVRLHTMFERSSPTAAPADVMAALNQELKALLPPGQYATALYGLFDPDTGCFSYATAAAPPFWSVGPQGVTRIDASGPLLGAFSQADYDNAQVTIPAGSTLFIHSDALTESERDDKPVADEETLALWLAECATSDDLPATIAHRFHQFLPGPPPDDLTLIGIRRTK